MSSWLAGYVAGVVTTVVTSAGFVAVLELVRRRPAVARSARPAPRLEVVHVPTQRVGR